MLISVRPAESLTMLCGMMIQLVTSSLAARTLFVCSAAPLVGYMALLPIAGFGTKHLVEGLTGSACTMLLVSYLAALWRDYQSRLFASQALRWDAVAHQQAAERANAAKTTFLAVTSHEVRTPLNAVLGELLLELLLRLNQGRRVGEVQDPRRLVGPLLRCDIVRDQVVEAQL